jgi:signal peptidase I
MPTLNFERTIWKRWLFGNNSDMAIYRALLIAAITILGFRTLIVPIRVSGNSMLPDYEDGGLNFVNKWAYSQDVPVRGDVVGVRSSDPKVIYIKRVVGLPGETVSIRQGKVLVNGKPIEEPYTESEVPWNVGPMKLKPESYFVIGDNRGITIFGPVAGNQIIGKIMF